jgi:hypothetical protein
MQTVSLKNTAYFCGIAFGFLFIFACVFYFERLNSDAGYYFFFAVNSQNFHVEHGRLVLVLAEIMVVIGTWFHLPLKALAILYSLTHVLFFAALAWVSLTKFKHKNAAILITILQFIGLRYSVFTPQFELYYGLSILVFTLAYLYYLQEKKTPWKLINYGLVALLFTLIFTSHPMAIYCAFVALLLFFYNKSYRKAWLIAIVILLIYIVWKKFAVSDYEKSKFNGFSDALSHNLKNIFSSPFILKCIRFLLTYYWDCFMIFIMGLTTFSMTRKYKKALLYLLSIIGSLLIIWLMFPPNTMGRYIEQVYFPFVFLTCLWLFQEAITLRLLGVLAILIIYKSFSITNVGLELKKRSEQMAYFVAKAQSKKGTKFFVTEKDMGANLYAKGNWSYGFETLFYATMHAQKTVSITKDEDLQYNDNFKKIKPVDFLFRPFEIMQYQELNKRYFKLDTGLYQPLLEK